MATFGNRVKRLRTARGLTQSELAERIGSSQKQIWKYETDQNEPTLSVVLRLAIALDTSSDYLIGMTDNPERSMRDQRDLSEKERSIVKAVRSGDIELVLKAYFDDSETAKS